MAITVYTYNRILGELGPHIRLVAVSKTKPAADIKALYDLGQRDFGENYVQELTEKQQQLPADIHWHFIGHLQSNKVRQIISFVHLIHGVDSLRLLKEIDRQAGAKGRVVDVLLQVHIAREETKFGLDSAELADLMRELRAPANGSAPGTNPSATATPEDASPFPHVRVRGLMGMASFTEDPDAVTAEFRELKRLFDQYFAGGDATSAGEGGVSGGDAPILSMGMSADYQIAIKEGSNMVRIGSLLFGKRDQEL
jgi:PLP dependent protein